MTTTIALQLIVRAILQAGCGYLVAKGYAKEGAFNVDDIALAVVFLGTLGWSFYAKQKMLKQTSTTTTTTSTNSQNG